MSVNRESQVAPRRPKSVPYSPVVLGEPRHLAPPVDGHRQLADPVREKALGHLLAQPEPVIVARREIADVEMDRPEAGRLSLLALRDEAFSDSALIEHLEGAR